MTVEELTDAQLSALCAAYGYILSLAARRETETTNEDIVDGQDQGEAEK